MFREVIPDILRSVPCANTNLVSSLGTAFLLLIVAGCSEPDIAAPTMEQVLQEQQPDQESWYTQFDVMQGPEPRLQIHADYLAKYIESDSTYMILKGHPDSLNSRVLAYLFDEVGDSSATILARTW